MSLTGTWNLHIRSPHKQKCPHCDLMKDLNFICPQILVEESSDLERCYYRPYTPPERICSLSSVERKTYSFYLCANESLVSWFLLLASSSIFWSKNVSFFYGFRLDPAKNISFPERTTPKADPYTSQKILKYDKAAVCVESSNVRDAYAIDSPLSFSGNSGYSDACSSENPLTPLSTKCDSSSEVSDLDKASYCYSLFNLEGEDNDWISDFKSTRPFSTKCDSSTEASDLDTVTYLDSLLNLEGEDREWISDSKPELEYFDFPSPSCKSSWDPAVLSSEEDLFETQDMEQVIADEPLFWPFEEEFNWNSEEFWGSFSISPRKHINCFGTPDKSFGSKLQEGKLKLKKGYRRGFIFGKQNGDEAECRSKSETSRPSMLSRSSAKIATSEKRVDENELKPRVVPRIKPLSASMNSTKKSLVSNTVVPMGRGYFALDQELPIETLVGLEEFDGHEGLDSEFNENVLILDE